jgi:membrane protease YdiL (CAAX protease family)
MAIWADARFRWKQGLVGRVPLRSPRGVAAILVFLSTVGLVLVPPLWSLVAWLIEGSAPGTVELDKDLLAINLGFNALLLLVFPILAILISRPDEAGAVARRLNMYVTPRTWIYALLGVGVTLVSLLGLGAVLSALDALGWYHAEESELVPQIQALLTPAVVFAVPMIAAVTEEVYFRGLLQPRIGMIASSALFGLVHAGYGTALQIVAPFLLGLLFAYLYQRTRSLWAPIAAHFSFDFVQFLALYLTR